MNRTLSLGLISACAAFLPCPSAVAGQTLLQAPAGVTAISGLVLDTEGNPIQGVVLSDQSVTAQTDAEGRFLVSYAPRGTALFTLDGRRVGAKKAEDYGHYEFWLNVTGGMTNTLPYTIYLPRIDHDNSKRFSSPTGSATVVTSTSVPGVEIHLPAGTVVYNVNDRAIGSLDIVGFPSGEPPFPMPPGLDTAVYFTVQPGGSCLYTKSGTVGSAQIYYPNKQHLPAGTRVTFFDYEPSRFGWVAYGSGAVSKDKSQIVPSSGTVVRGFDAICPPSAPTANRGVRRVSPIFTGRGQ